MGLIRKDTYKPPFWLPGGHSQTIYPALFRKVAGVPYRRERITTPDGDFLSLDWCAPASGDKPNPLVILSHGFEGDSHRPYIRGMVRELMSIGFDCLAWNFRSCGGEMNLTPVFYHSGATDDLDLVVKHAAGRGYRKIYLVGFSLGGNLTLKYLGERRERPGELARAICFSVPMDLEACSRHLGRFPNQVYQRRFLETLRIKIREKSAFHPDRIDVRLLAKARSVYAFDDLFTAPLHGFEDARDYYTRCSSKHYIASIGIPTLIVNAENDPMIPAGSLPLDEVAGLGKVDMWLTSRGGHCGFPEVRAGRQVYWSEEKAKQFLGSGIAPPGTQE